MAVFDFSPYNLPISEADIVAAEAKFKQSRTSVWVFRGISGGFVMFLWIMFLPMFTGSGIATLISFVIAAGLAVWAGYGGGKVFENMRKNLVRLDRLAQANGLHYWPNQTVSNHTGLIFTAGHSNRSSDIFFTNQGQVYEFGNHTYTIGHGKHSRTFDFGYISIHLDRNLPHMVLDGRANNSKFLGEVSNLSIGFDKTQRLSLEGDFDKYFTLYAPKKYEADALYVFTPDLMALFIDEVHKFDAEIIDSRLYIYSEKFDFSQQAVYEKIFQIINAVAVKTGRRTDYYADSRVGDRDSNIVADEGRRLKRPKANIVAIIVFFVIFFIFSIGISILSSMSS